MELLYVLWSLAALATFVNTILLLVLSVVIGKMIAQPATEEEPKKKPVQEQAGLMDVEGQHYPYHLPRP